MIPACKSASKICLLRCQIWPDFAKSWIWPGSQIWISPFDFNVLWGAFQICQRAMPNLLTNLEFLNKNRHFCQISDLSESTPKGVGGLPRKAGGPPPTPGHSSRAEVVGRDQSDDGGRYRQASTAVVFHPSS
jgi:hypothetical protein